MTSAPDQPFWETKTLSEMTDAEWESLCDGCGRCCLVTLIDDDEPDIIGETSVHCRLFDPSCRRCKDYANRTERVPTCVNLTPRNIGGLTFMPSTCAYRRLAEGRSLPSWHPLKTGDPDSVQRAGAAVAEPLTDETDVPEDELWRYITHERPAR